MSESENSPPEKSPAGGQRILIAHFDLFKNVGGGQSVYKAIIESRSNDTFYYFREAEAADAPRPANAVAIPYRPVYLRTRDVMPFTLLHFFNVYLDCRNFAASVAQHSPGISFDVVDVPDFSQSGLFLARSLAAEGIPVGMTAIAMHGTLSHALRSGWPVPGGMSRLLAELRTRERLHFRAVDARYALSEPYAREWQRAAPLSVNHLDPLCAVGEAAPAMANRSGTPDLVFVGRREKCKGPDLFLDFAWGLDTSSYGRLIMVGPDGPNHLGASSMEFLPRIASLRGLKPEYTGSISSAELNELYDGNSVLLLPSRRDTFNLRWRSKRCFAVVRCMFRDSRAWRSGFRRNFLICRGWSWISIARAPLPPSCRTRCAITTAAGPRSLRP